MQQTKIVATIGPASCDSASLTGLHKRGMSVARLNGSHADLVWHRNAILLIRATLPDVPILLDIPGRKIRTTTLAHEPSFATGDSITLTTDLSFDGRLKVPVNYANLSLDLSVGDRILADDGTLNFEVISISGADIVCRAGNDGTLRSCKGINVPYVKLNTALVTDRDRKMVAFAKELGVDFIGISFVESAQHVEAIRELVDGPLPRILAKVENQGGLDNLDEIVQAADAIMIDRGDLSVETSIETLAIYQKKIIGRARAAGKPVIVATEMLHSMIQNDFPTKAEVADITNAVLDGCSATMLSGETAVGRFPFQAVDTMRRVCDAAFHHSQVMQSAQAEAGAANASQVMEDAIALILRSLPITKVVAITRSGYAARMLSSRAISQPILAMSDDPAMARSFNLCSGVEGVSFDAPFQRGSADHIKACIHELYDTGRVTESDMILVTGLIYPRSGTRMNLIQIHKISDLVEEFQWDMPQNNKGKAGAAAQTRIVSARR